MYVHAETLARCREADSAHGALAHVNVRSKTATSLVAGDKETVVLVLQHNSGKLYVDEYYNTNAIFTIQKSKTKPEMCWCQQK